MTDKKGYYKELGLEKTATTEEIKQTYRKMALKWHPDKNPDNVQQATQVFQKISEAYSVLSDDKKREQYDRFGSVEGFDFDYDDFVGHFDFDGLFNMMFGGMELFSTLGAMGAMDSKHGHSKRKGAGHGFIKTSNKRAQAQMAKMFADPFGMGMNMGGEKKKSKDKEKAKADEGWETEEEYSDDDEDETNTETPAHADKKSAANGDKRDEKTGAKEEESKKKDPVEDKDEDYEDMDEDGDYDDFDEDIDDYGDNMDEETERRINKEMYGEEDEEDFKNFEDFMGKAENMFFLPMFAAENSKDVDKKRTKCNLCKQVMPNDDIFEHMSKQHKKQLDTYIEKAATEDYERDEKRMKNDPFSMLAGAMGGKGMAGMAGMFDMMGGMDVGGKKGKNKKKK